MCRDRHSYQNQEYNYYDVIYIVKSVYCIMSIYCLCDVTLCQAKCFNFIHFQKYSLQYSRNMLSICDWASEASPTLGCSIEISRDIYVSMYVYVCLWETHTKNLYAKMHGRNYVVQARTFSK